MTQNVLEKLCTEKVCFDFLVPSIRNAVAIFVGFGTIGCSLQFLKGR